MKVLFINPALERCGVHQYGLRLYSILVGTVKFHVDYSTEETCENFGSPDVVVYNWHPIIDYDCRVLDSEKFAKSKKVIVYHDGDLMFTPHAILFSNPAVDMPEIGWHFIGRPLPEWIPTPVPDSDRLKVGISGFCGGWAGDSVAHIVANYDCVDFRLHLPHSDWCDATGAAAHASAEHCRSLIRPGDTMEVTHTFMSQQDLLAWLSCNHLNCFIRSNTPSRGISSAIDNALAVRRPIAVNRSPMFRHLFDLKPSILIDDTPIRDIIQNGVAPLVPVYHRNCRETVQEELEKILLSL